MVQYLLEKAHIMKLNQVKEWTVTELTNWTIDETASAILNTQGSGGITNVRSQMKFLLGILILSILTELADIVLETGI